MSIVEARKNLAELVNRVSYGRERITLTRRARPAAVVVTPEDAELLELIEATIDIETARARLQSAKERPIPWSQARKRLAQ
jgi:prevent-host-death family protein